MCGWESRDLRDLLESRWAQKAPEEYEAERATIRDLTPLDAPASKARVKAGPGHTGADALALLDALRAEDPDEPFWTGIKRIATEGDHVDVEWHEPVSPRPLASGDVTVECHLYDEDALAEAERRRAEQAGV